MDEAEIFLQISAMIHVTITVMFIIYFVWRAQMDLMYELYGE